MIRLRLSKACCFFVILAFSIYTFGQEEEETWSLSLDNVPIEDFAKEISLITGKTIVVDARVKGNVNVYSTKELGDDDIYDLFLGTLRILGFGVIEEDGEVKVVQSQQLRQYGLDRNTDLADASPDSMISTVLLVEHVDALELTKILRLISPAYSHIAAIPDTDAIIITDHKGNVEAMKELIKLLDVPDERQTILIQLEHAWVEDVDEMLKTLLPREIKETEQGDLFLVGNSRTNSLILRGRDNAIAKALEIIQIIDQPTSVTGLIKVFRLNYAKAEDVAGVLNAIVSPESGVSTSDAKRTGLITHDPGLNAVIVRGEPNVVSELAQIIAELDVRRAQVLIEAAIVEVRIGDDENLGVEISVGDDRGTSTPVATSSLTGILSALLGSLAADGDIKPEDVEAFDLLRGISSPTLAVAKLDPDGVSFGAILNALFSSTEANLLSSPHVMAVDNDDARLQVGNVIPIRSGNFVFPGQQTDFPFQSNSREPIGVELKVTPYINADNTVRMEILQSVENVVSPDLGIGDTGFADVVTAKSEIETTVIAENRHTVVLGGLIKNDTQTTTRRVPGLGRIPLLGRLFRSTASNTERRNLLVFIRPTVVTTPEESEAVTQAKYDGIWSSIIEFNGGQAGQQPPMSDLYEGKKP